MTRLERLKLLQEKWKSVDPGTVDLEIWSCGTYACLGGHAAQMPEFMAEGFEIVCDVPNFRHHIGMAACTEFFGDRWGIFDCRGVCCFDQEIENASDYKLAAHRLARAIEEF